MRTSATTRATVLPVELEEQLGYGKYTAWVLHGSFLPDHLLCLLCMIGEFNQHAPQILRRLWANEPQLAGADRSVLALEALQCMVRGERFGKDAWARNLFAWRRYREEGAMPAEERDGHMAKPMALSATLGEAAAREVRARWGAVPPLADEHLRCILWLIGEFSARAHVVLRLLDECAGQLAGAERAVIALKAMHAMVWLKERFDVGEFDRCAARGRAQLAFGDLPDAARVALLESAPRAQWRTVLRKAWGYLLVANDDAGGDALEAELRLPREVSLKRYLPWAAVPAEVASAIAARFPEFDRSWAYGRLTGGGTIGAYEIEYYPRTGISRRPRRIVVSTDGGEMSEAEM